MNNSNLFLKEDTEEREPLNTQDMLESNFLSAINKIDLADNKNVSNVKFAQSQNSDTIKTGNTEVLLTTLYDVRDSLLTLFDNTNYNSPLCEILTDNINKLGSCISQIGGHVETFNPLDHVSGLKSPDVQKNAHKVIENTKEFYDMGTIEDACVKDNGKTISITFVGKNDNTKYKAIGTINVSGSWGGNEAIDYVYTPSEGKMSVKVLDENGQWKDKSNNYEIFWELEEKTNEDNEEKTNEGNTPVYNDEMKDVKTEPENNIEDKDENQETALELDKEINEKKIKKSKEADTQLENKDNRKDEDDFPIITL